MKNLKSSAKLTSLLFITSFFNYVSAHEFLSEILTQQNANGNFVIVATYHLTQNEINEVNGHSVQVDYIKNRSNELVAIPRDPAQSCEKSGSRTCGQFDHFSQARSAAVSTCYELGIQQKTSYPSQLVPLYLGPSSFVDSDKASADHHLNYHLLHGLSFSCGYLEPNHDVNS